MPHFLFIHTGIGAEAFDPECPDFNVDTLTALDVGDAVLQIEHRHSLREGDQGLLAVLTVEEAKTLIYDMEFPKPATNGYWGYDHELKRFRLLTTISDTFTEVVTEALALVEDQRMSSIRGRLLNFYDVSNLLVNLQIEIDALS